MKKILVFGGSGLVGSRFIQLYGNSFKIKAPTANDVDILNPHQISQEIEKFNPDGVINFAAYTNVEDAEKDKDNKEGICYQINVNGAKNVAEACKKQGKYLVYISTEYVFDGQKELSSYNEEDSPNPINWYGLTKYLGEKVVSESGSKSVIVRISMPYTVQYELKKDVVRFFLEQLKAKKPLKAIEDQRITPTLVDDIADALKVILENEPLGIYHVSAKDSVTPLELAKTIAEEFELDYSLISSIKLDEYNKSKKAKLLRYSWLNPAKFEKEFGDEILHTVEEGLIIFKQLLTKS